MKATLTARRGVSLAFWAVFAERGITMPSCAACRCRHTAGSIGVNYGGVISLVVAVLLPLLTPINGPPIATIAAIAVRYAGNRGNERADWQAFGVRGSLAADATTVHLRFRDARRELAVREASAEVARSD